MKMVSIKKQVMGFFAILGIGGWLFSALIKSLSGLVWLWVGLILFNANAEKLELTPIFIKPIAWSIIFIFLIVYKLWASSGVITTKRGGRE